MQNIKAVGLIFTQFREHVWDGLPYSTDHVFSVKALGAPGSISKHYANCLTAAEKKCKESLGTASLRTLCTSANTLGVESKRIPSMQPQVKTPKHRSFQAHRWIYAWAAPHTGSNSRNFTTEKLWVAIDSTGQNLARSEVVNGHPAL